MIVIGPIPWWAFVAYLILVACTVVGCSLLAYRKGRDTWRDQAMTLAARLREHDERVQDAEHSARFRVRTRSQEPEQPARVRVARVRAIRYPRPEPRRGKS